MAVELIQFKVSDTSAVSALISISVKNAKQRNHINIPCSKLEDQNKLQHSLTAHTEGNPTN
jgi:hypothetical protein